MTWKKGFKKKFSVRAPFAKTKDGIRHLTSIMGPEQMDDGINYHVSYKNKNGEGWDWLVDRDGKLAKAKAFAAKNKNYRQCGPKCYEEKPAVKK